MVDSDMLSDEDLQFLDAFLLERIDEDSEEEEGDEGLVSVFELDGFLTGVVCAPVFRPPSFWLDRVWGDYPPRWRDEAEAQEVMGLLLAHLNSISGLLRRDPPELAPVFGEPREADGPPVVSDWCDGFMDAVQFDEEAWSGLGDDAEEALGVISLFSAASDYAADQLPEADQLAAAELIPDAAARLFTLQAATPPAATVRRSAPKIGRNDPCSCGSGRKYKHCCLSK